jgi:hypothetical protein
MKLRIRSKSKPNLARIRSSSRMPSRYPRRRRRQVAVVMFLERPLRARAQKSREPRDSKS